jgi:hypothetical protein
MPPSSSQLARMTTQPLPLSAYQLRVRVRAGDKWLVPGMTGSGKTTFGKRLLAQLVRLYPTSRVYILDSKFLGDFDDYPGRMMSDTAPRKPASDERYQVWQPVLEIPDEIERWLWQIRKDAPAILFVDELLTLCYKRTLTSPEYARLQKLGRALPVGCITCTQELVQIPRQAIGQATHIARFRLKQPYERRVMNSIMGDELEEPPDEHGFYYGSAIKPGATYFSSVQRFL